MSCPRAFRFFRQNRQKYLLFVSTCSEKDRGRAQDFRFELGNLQPDGRRPLRIFDAGVGDGTVLSRVMAGRLHAPLPDHAAFTVVAKENQL